MARERLSNILTFGGKYWFLSNFSPSPIRYEYDPNTIYPTAEHAFQAQKSLSLVERHMVRDAPTPKRAKFLGRNKIKLRDGWDDIKLAIMEDVVWRKFTQNVELGKRLLDTGKALLVEGNHWDDAYWGKVLIDGQWTGENHLGLILMTVRQRLLDESVGLPIDS